MKKALLLALFLFSSLLFAAPVLNIQGKLNGVSSGSITASIFSTSACSGTALLTGSDSSVDANGVFDIPISTSGATLLSANTPYYLRLVYGSTTVVSCQQFYPHQVDGGAISPSTLKVGDISTTGGISDFSQSSQVSLPGNTRFLPSTFNILNQMIYLNSGGSPPLLTPRVTFGSNPVDVLIEFTVGGSNNIYLGSGTAWLNVPVTGRSLSLTQGLTVVGASNLQGGISNSAGSVTVNDPLTATGTITGGNLATAGAVTGNALTIGSGTGGVASVGSLVVRGSTATVNGQDVCLENGVNCPSGGSADYVLRDGDTMTGALVIQDGSTATRDLSLTDIGPVASNSRLVLGIENNANNPALRLYPVGPSSTKRYIELQGPLQIADSRLSPSSPNFLGLTVIGTLGSPFNGVPVRGISSLSGNPAIPINFTTGIRTDVIRSSNNDGRAINVQNDLTLSSSSILRANTIQATTGSVVTLNHDLAVPRIQPTSGGSPVLVTGTGGLKVSPGPIEAAEVRSIASAGDLALRVGTSVANDKIVVKRGTNNAVVDEVCLKNAANCGSGGGSGAPDVEYKVTILPFVDFFTGWDNAVEWGPNWNDRTYPNINWNVPRCWAHCNGHTACGGVDAWIDKTPSCSAGYALAGCTVTMFDYSYPANTHYIYASLKSLCIQS